MPVEPSDERRTSSVWGTIAVVVLAYNLLLGLLIVGPVVTIAMLDAGWGARPLVLVALAGTLVAEMLILVLLRAWLRRTSRCLGDLGLRRRGAAWATVIALVFGAGYAAFTFGIPAVAAHATELGLFKIAGAAIGVFAAVVEELVFRGFLLTEMRRRGIGIVSCVLVSGVTFALIHVGFSLPSVAVTFVMGAFLAILYLRSGHALVPCILSHALINLLIEPWLLLHVVTSYNAMFQG